MSDRDPIDVALNDLRSLLDDRLSDPEGEAHEILTTLVAAVGKTEVEERVLRWALARNTKMALLDMSMLELEGRACVSALRAEREAQR